MPEPTNGTWQIVATSLPFWKSRSAPAVTYAALPDGRILDAVTYLRNGRSRLVLGVDSPDDDGFVWRGLQLVTRFTTSRWRVVASDETAAHAAAVSAIAARRDWGTTT